VSCVFASSVFPPAFTTCVFAPRAFATCFVEVGRDADVSFTCRATRSGWAAALRVTRLWTRGPASVTAAGREDVAQADGLAEAQGPALARASACGEPGIPLFATRSPRWAGGVVDAVRGALGVAFVVPGVALACGACAGGGAAVATLGAASGLLCAVLAAFGVASATFRVRSTDFGVASAALDVAVAAFGIASAAFGVAAAVAPVSVCAMSMPNGSESVIGSAIKGRSDCLWADCAECPHRSHKRRNTESGAAEAACVDAVVDAAPICSTGEVVPMRFVAPTWGSFNFGAALDPVLCRKLEPALSAPLGAAWAVTRGRSGGLAERGAGEAGTTGARCACAVFCASVCVGGFDGVDAMKGLDVSARDALPEAPLPRVDEPLAIGVLGALLAAIAAVARACLSSCFTAWFATCELAGLFPVSACVASSWWPVVARPLALPSPGTSSACCCRRATIDSTGFCRDSASAGGCRPSSRPDDRGAVRASSALRTTRHISCALSRSVVAT
jgi:hypothetical protein